MISASKYRRWILYVYSFLCASLVAGLVYGWPALRRQLLDEGSELSEKTLGAIFTIGAWSTQGLRFFTGLARDRFGTRSLIGVCFLIVIAGTFGMSMSDPDNAVALAISLFAIGVGSGVQLCIQPVAGLFPSHSGTILSSLAGAFQISGLVFLALTSGVMVTRRAAFLAFSVFLAFLGVGAVILFPKGGSFVLEDCDDEDPKVERDETTETVFSRHNSSSLFGSGRWLTTDSNSVRHISKPDVLDREIRAAPSATINDSLQTSDDGDRAGEKWENDPNLEDQSGGNRGSEDLSRDEGRVQKETAGLEVDTPMPPTTLVQSLISSKLEDQSGGNRSSIDLSSRDVDKTEKGTAEPDVADTPKTPTAFEQLKSAEYLLLCVWFSVNIVPLQYYVGSIGFQLEEKGDDDGLYTNLFAILYAAVAPLAPAGGYLADKAGLGVGQGVGTVLVAFSFLILSSDRIPLPGQGVGLACYSIGRMLVFGMFFSNMGKRFGYKNFGTLAGLGLLISAIASLLQYPLIAATVDGNAAIVNASCGIVLLCMMPYFFWLHRQEYPRLLQA